MIAKRLRAHSGVFLSLLAAVAVVSALGVCLVGLLRISATDAVRAEFSSASRAAAGLHVSVLWSDDGEEQDRSMRAAISRAFTGNGRTTPLEVNRALTAPAGSLNLNRVDGGATGAASAAVASYPDLATSAELVAGSWPANRHEASIQADAAKLLALAPGDVIRIGAAELVLAGTWRVTDVLDPQWMGDPLMLSGSSDGVGPIDVGPIVVEEAAWHDMGVTPMALWTITPDAERLTTADVSTIIAATGDVRAALLDASDTDLGSPKARGQLGTTAIEVQEKLNALRAVEPVALVTVAAMALITLLELARLLASARAAENRLLWSRGASERYFVREVMLETGSIAAVGAILGSGVAVTLLSHQAGLASVLAVGTELWAVPVLTTLSTVLVFAIGAVNATRRTDSRGPSSTGRQRTVIGAGVVALVLAAAAASTWQLLLYGSPLSPVAGGGTAIDVFSVLAPSLVIVAIALLGIVAFRGIAYGAERFARTARRLADVLALRTVARSLELAATPILLVSLACGQLVIACAYSTTWSQASAVASELRAGAAIRLSSPTAIGNPVLELAAATPGVTSAVPVVVDTARFGSHTNVFVGATPFAFAHVATGASGHFDGASVAAALRTDLPFPILADGAHAVRLVVETAGMDPPSRIELRLSDATGVAAALPLAREPAPGGAGSGVTTAYAGQLPAAATPATEQGWIVLAVDVRPGAVHSGAPEPRFTLAGLAVANESGESTEIDLGGYWMPRGFPLREEPLASTSGGHGFIQEPGFDLVRMLPSFDGEPSDAVAARVVASQALADRYSVEVGSFFSLDPSGPAPGVSAVVTAVVPAVPGVDDDRSMLVDLHLLQALELRATESLSTPALLWVAADDPATVSAALRDALPGDIQLSSVADDPSRTMLASAAIALWLGAGGSALLAVFAVGATAASQLRARRREVVVLRAIGVSPRMLGSIRLREFGVVLGYATAVGLLIGVSVTYLMVPLFARAAVPAQYESIPTPVQLEPLVAVGAVGALAATLVCMTAVYAGRVIAQARASSTRGEES